MTWLYGSSRYVQSQAMSKVRLLNLSPDTKVAGMTGSLNGTKELASNVCYSLGSVWYSVSTESASYSAVDDLSGEVLTTKVETPPAAPLGYTNFLLGLQSASGSFGAQMVSNLHLGSSYPHLILSKFSPILVAGPAE